MNETKVVRIPKHLYENATNLRKEIGKRLLDLNREGYKVKLESIGLGGFIGYLVAKGISKLVSDTVKDEDLLAWISHL
jgi:hypothetical protein